MVVVPVVVPVVAIVSPLVSVETTGPRTALATAPLPLLQASLITILGGEVYPLPADIISTPINDVAALIIALPLAPLPPPPINSTVGGPQSLGPTFHPPADTPNLAKVSEKSILRPVIFPAALNASLAALALLTN